MKFIGTFYLKNSSTVLIDSIEIQEEAKIKTAREEINALKRTLEIVFRENVNAFINFGKLKMRGDSIAAYIIEEVEI